MRLGRLQHRFAMQQGKTTLQIVEITSQGQGPNRRPMPFEMMRYVRHLLLGRTIELRQKPDQLAPGRCQFIQAVQFKRPQQTWIALTQVCGQILERRDFHRALAGQPIISVQVVCCQIGIIADLIGQFS